MSSSKTVATYDQIADQLTTDFWASVYSNSGHRFDVAPGGTITANISNLAPGGQQLARWALEAVG